METTMQGIDPMSRDTGLGDRLPLWYLDRHVWQTQQPALAFLAESLSIEAACSWEVTTATTDGVRLLVNPKWSATLDDKTRRFVQAHLVLHCAIGHSLPSSVRATRRWHLTCDHEVNACLLMLGIPLPQQAVLFPSQVGKPLPTVYAWLADNPLLEAERSLDVPPWHVVRPTKADQPPWRELIIQLVKRFLGTPDLPPPVASWLLSRW